MILRFKRLTRLNVLRRISRPLLNELLARFAVQLSAAGLAAPDPGLGDPAWLDAVARLLVAPEALPDALAEALFLIDELASAEGIEQVELALTRAGSTLSWAAGSSREDMLLQLWQTDAALLMRVHQQQRLRRLCAFECFGGAARVPGSVPPLSIPDRPMLPELTRALEPWFARHGRGQNTVRVAMCQSGEALDGADEGIAAAEYWFVIRHGDTFSRTPKVEEQRTEILHFRPERDDLVVYSARYDELRINARTRGERELYARTFGRFLRGDENHFARRSTYTLDPLQRTGAAALDVDGVEGIHRIALREVEVAGNDPLNEITTYQAEDLFRCGAGFAGFLDTIPSATRLKRAAFEVQFSDATKPRAVQIRLPNWIKLGRHSDLDRVDAWLRHRGFRNHQLAA